VRYLVEQASVDTRDDAKRVTAFMRGSWFRVAGKDGHTAAYTPDEQTARIIAEALTDADIHGARQGR